MARRSDSQQATETLQEIQSVFDRMSDWTARHPWQVLGALAAILVAAGTVGAVQVLGERAAAQASAEVAEVQRSYQQAMGAQPGSAQVVEPANPELAEGIRREHAERFLEVAAEHEGTAAAVTAHLEAADLLERVGEAERAREIWREAADAASNGSVLQAMALERYAVSLEGGGDFAAAAEAHARAGAVEAFPGRWLALAGAARSWLEAGDSAKALAIFDRLEADAPSGAVPPHVMARLRIARAASQQVR